MKILALAIAVISFTCCKAERKTSLPHDFVQYIDSENRFNAEYTDHSGATAQTTIAPQNVYRSLLDEFHDATIESTTLGTLEIHSLIPMIDNQSRDGIVCRTDTSITFPAISIEPESILYVSRGLLLDELDTSSPLPRFIVRVSDPESRTETVLDDFQRSSSSSGMWHDKLIDLHPYTGKKIEITLATEGGSPSHQTCWSGLKLLQKANTIGGVQ